MSDTREYERTHPWIGFRLDLRRASSSLWMNLGAIQSKCEHVAHVMVPVDVGRRLHAIYLAKGVRATTAIEGNTLSEEEVRRRIRTREPLPKSREYLGQEVDNIVDTCNELADEMIEKGLDSTITAERIMHFNKMVLRNLQLHKEVMPGIIRVHGVGVARYRGAPAADCEYLLRRTCEWINGLQPDSADNRIAYAVLRGALLHLYLAWIHPFGDGNGRTARLAEVQILLGAGVPMVAAHLLSNHYNQTRDEYYRQLSAASQSGDVLPFLEYAVQGFTDGLHQQILHIRRFQRTLAWKDYVYERFRGQKTEASHRQRQIALELARYGSKGVNVSQIRTLNTELAALYAKKTPKTITRDLNKLVQMKLVARRGARGARVYAREDILKMFLPRRRKGDWPHFLELRKPSST